MENPDNDESDIKVSRATINILCDHDNLNIILDPMADMEDMGTHKQCCTMF